MLARVQSGGGDPLVGGGVEGGFVPDAIPNLERERKHGMKIKATILVEPIGEARPRHRSLPDGRIIDYIPEPTRKTQWAIQMVIRNVVIAKGKFAPDAPIRMEATFYRLRPKHLPKRVQLPISRPDWDNCGKLVSDSLEQYTFRNDSQITTCLIKKRFGDPPRIELLLEEDTL